MKSKIVNLKNIFFEQFYELRGLQLRVGSKEYQLSDALCCVVCLVGATLRSYWKFLSCWTKMCKNNRLKEVLFNMPVWYSQTSCCITLWIGFLCRSKFRKRFSIIKIFKRWKIQTTQCESYALAHKNCFDVEKGNSSYRVYEASMSQNQASLKFNRRYGLEMQKTVCWLKKKIFHSILIRLQFFRL